MAYEKRDGDIAIFQQADKRNERGPDWRGEALIDGKTYEVALWFKGGKGTMLAGQLKPARERQPQAEDSFRGGAGRGGSQGVAGHGRDLDDEIPF
jgi:hypothetical protein